MGEEEYSSDESARPLFTNEADVAWDNYPMIDSGIYEAHSVKAETYRDPRFGWKTRVHWRILDRDGNQVAVLAQFYNLGKDKQPRAGRSSKYWNEWIAANGKAPARSDRLTPRVFVDRHAVVEVDLVNSFPLYSVVSKVKAWK